jgi:uncharacterized protein
MTDAGTHSTRRFLLKLFASIHETGFGTTFQDALSQDVVWTATGNSPLAGIYRGKQAYLDNVLNVLHERLATPIRPQLHRMVVEGEWASVYFESRGVRGKNGSDFSMHYVWLIRVVEEEVVEVVGFYDQKKMHDLFA